MAKREYLQTLGGSSETYCPLKSKQVLCRKIMSCWAPDLPHGRGCSNLNYTVGFHYWYERIHRAQAFGRPAHSDLRLQQTEETQCPTKMAITFSSLYIIRGGWGILRSWGSRSGEIIEVPYASHTLATVWLRRECLFFYLFSMSLILWDVVYWKDRMMGRLKGFKVVAEM